MVPLFDHTSLFCIFLSARDAYVVHHVYNTTLFSILLLHIILE
jgi:hypothetical protein